MRALVCVLAFILTVAAQWAPAVGQGGPRLDGKIGPGEYAKSRTHERSDATLSWSIVGDTIHIGFQMKSEGWVGIGLLEHKTKDKQGADQYIFTIDDGKPMALDLYQSTPTKRPVPDEEEGGKNSIIQFAVVRDKDDWTVEFSRKLNTAEKTDMEIAPGRKFTLLLAHGEEENWRKEHRKSRRWDIEGFAFER
jgi:hypothetical protein